MSILHDAGPRLRVEDFRLLRDLVNSFCGIAFQDDAMFVVERRLRERLQALGLPDYAAYHQYLRYHPDAHAELERAVDALTTNETYFFREPQQFDVFTDKLVPMILEEKKGLKDIKIWSAASSSGEEPYTISMLLREKYPQVRVDIVGSDLSSAVIEAAKRGVYSSYSVRNVPEMYMKKYFMQRGQDYLLSASIKASVRYKSVNLVEKQGGVSDLRGLDIIFCRNVLIYFDEKAKQKAVSFLYDSLRPGGYLIIGSSESLHSVTRAFKPTTINKVVVYQRV